MKRFTLTLAAIIGFAAAVNAQTYVGDIPGVYLTISIPGEFTTSGHPYVVFLNYLGDEHYSCSIYQSDFTTHVTDINSVDEVWIFNLDITAQHDIPMYVTQNLFNSDEQFEYFEYERVYLGDYDEWAITSIHIKSTNGSTLWSYHAEDGYYISPRIIKLDNKYYLVVDGYNWQEESNYNHLYFISQTDGLTKVDAELPISVFPTMPTREQQITVELGEGNNAKEITVVNSLGQVVKRVPVQEGQRQITIPVQGLNSGLNVVNTRTEQGQGSCKIIVR